MSFQTAKAVLETCLLENIRRVHYKEIGKDYVFAEDPYLNFTTLTIALPVTDIDLARHVLRKRINWYQSPSNIKANR